MALVSAALLGGALLAGCGSSDDSKDGGKEVDPALQKLLPADIRDSGEITVGTTAAQSPLEFVDEKSGKIVGFFPDLLRAAGELLGLDVEMQKTTFDASIPGLSSGRFDLIAQMGDLPDRREKVDFIDSLQNGFGFLASTSLEADSIPPEDLCGLKVAAIRGSASDSSAHGWSDDCTAGGKAAINLTTYEDAAACILAAQSKQSDMCITVLPAALYNAKKDPDRLKVVYRTTGYTLGTLVLKGNDEFRDAMQAAIRELVANGDYDELLDQYGLSDLGMPEVPLNAGVAP